jgi:hypothetical protein
MSFAMHFGALQKYILLCDCLGVLPTLGVDLNVDVTISQIKRCDMIVSVNNENIFQPVT